MFSLSVHVLFTDRAFNKTCKLRKGQRQGSSVSSLKYSVFGLRYYRLEQVFGDEFLFLDLSIGSGAMAAFSHLRLLPSFSQENFKFAAKAQWARPIGIGSLS